MGTTRIDIERLSADDRLRLLERIWDSLAPDAVPVTEPQRVELDRRLDDAEHDGSVGIPWDDVMRRLLTHRR